MSVTIAGKTSGTITFDEDLYESNYHKRTRRIQKTKTLDGGVFVNVFGDINTIVYDFECTIVASLSLSQETSLNTIMRNNDEFTVTITHPETGESNIVNAIDMVCPDYTCKWGALEMTLWAS